MNIKDCNKNTMSAHYVKGIIFVALKLFSILYRRDWLVSVPRSIRFRARWLHWGFGTDLWNRLYFCTYSWKEWPLGNFADLQSGINVTLIVIQLPPDIGLSDLANENIGGSVEGELQLSDK